MLEPCDSANADQGKLIRANISLAHFLAVKAISHKLGNSVSRKLESGWTNTYGIKEQAEARLSGF